MGEIIEFKRGPTGTWDDSGEPTPLEDAPEPPRFRLLLLPIHLFVDVLAMAIAFICRPIAASVLIGGVALVWLVLRQKLGFGVELALALCLALWLVGQIFDITADRLIDQINAGERLLVARGGPALALGAYAWVMIVPGLWLRLALGLDRPALTWSLGLMCGAAAGLARYRWEP